MGPLKLMFLGFALLLLGLPRVDSVWVGAAGAVLFALAGVWMVGSAIYDLFYRRYD